MKKSSAPFYVCPYSRGELTLHSDRESGSDVVEGHLTSPEGRKYQVVDGIPFLLDRNVTTLDPNEERECAFYQEHFNEYDGHMEWLFRSFFLDEFTIRDGIVDQLELSPDACVLETGCGTCRDSELIARRLSPSGALYLQDLSENMLRLGRERLLGNSDGADGPTIEFSLGSATTLAFADNSFDVAFHFGGLNMFSDIPAALAEMARVVKPGGKVVVGDEGMAPWLRDREFGKILMNSHHLYRFELPISQLPECAADVSVRWPIANAFYVIAFRVAEGPPKVDLDLPIPGPRGGTHRTRYFGSVEGISPNLRDAAITAARDSGMTVHAWLEEAVSAKLGRR